jgi:membrane-associated protein
LPDIHSLIDHFRDIEGLIRAVGYVGLFLIVFAETGLLVGFFLPGDTLLLTAGLLAQRGELEIWILIPLLFVAAVVGDATGYTIGKQAGPRLFTKEDARFFRKRHLMRAKGFYDKHGGKTIVIARFLAIIRTFAPTVAGAVEMPYRRFAFFNVFGAGLWVGSMTLLGYFVGKAVPNLDAVFLGIVAVIIVVSVAPAVLHLRRERAHARREAAGIE